MGTNPHSSPRIGTRGDLEPRIEREGALSVYLAGCFKRREELCLHASELEAQGMVVTSRWLRGSAKLTGTDLQQGERGARLAAMDFEDLGAADVCVSFTESADAFDRGRGGRHTELGIALGLGRLVMIVGPVEHVFHRLPGIERHDEWATARRRLLNMTAPLVDAA